MKEKWKKAFSLYWYFFVIGWYTFGGGWSIVAQIQKDYVEKKKEIPPEQLLDIVSVGRSLPGTMIGNVAFLFGYDRAGIPGGVMSVLGIISPPLIILTLVTFFYTRIQNNIWVAKAMTGVRAVVAPVILSACLKLLKGAFPVLLCYVLCAAACILNAFYDVSAVLLVLAAVLCGLLLIRKKEEKK